MQSLTDRENWQTESTERPFTGGESFGTHGKMGETWLATLREIFPAGGGHLDVGCGEGKITFALADLWAQGGWSVGADRDERTLGAARERAGRENLTGAEFHLLDVEKESYSRVLSGRVPDVITAHLCMGAEIVERAAAALAPGGKFACVALHSGLYLETGSTGRFSLSETALETMFGRFGLSPIFLRVEKETLEFHSPDEMLKDFFQEGRAVPAWKNDGRWEGVEKYAANGGRTLTVRAQAQCIARKATS